MSNCSMNREEGQNEIKLLNALEQFFVNYTVSFKLLLEQFY